MFSLRIYNHEKLIKEESLDVGKPVCIGRHRLNDIQLPDPACKVSRFHVALFCNSEGQYYIQDLGSRNSTLVNGRIRNNGKLNEGDEIGIGDYVLTFQRQTAKDKQQKTKFRVVDDTDIPDRKTTFSPAVESRDDTNVLGDEYLHLLYEVSRYNNLSLDLEDTLQLSVEKLYGKLCPERIFIALLEPEHDDLKCLAKYPVEEAEIKVSRTMLRCLLKEKQILVTNNALIDERFEQEGRIAKSLQELQISSAACIPLQWDGEIKGILYLDSREARLFSEQDVTLFTLLGQDISTFLERVYAYKAVREEKIRLEERLAVDNTIIGVSPAIRSLRDTLEKIGRKDITVLLTGETGTGKDTVAEAIHRHSPRYTQPFIEVNCAAIPDNLLESELFGVVANYPGFHNKEPLKGKFQLAQGGTIFLNEIGELDLKLQAKLLEVFDTHCIWPLGADKPLSIDLRIIAATNRNLQEEIKSGRFREDLYERLNVFPLHLPPLRERKEDIPILAGYFLYKMREKHSKPISRFSNACMELLCKHSWPRNVRELRNSIERAIITAERAILTPDLFPWIASDDKTPRSLKEIEKEHIRKVLEYTKGNKQKAMRILGISKQTLYNKGRQYKLPDFEGGV